MKVLLSMLLLLSFVGCSSRKAAKHEIEQKVQESTVKDSEGLGETIRSTIHGSSSLTDAQKKQLEDIFAANKKKAEELTERSYKLRSVLINELLSGKVDQRKVKLLKKDIRKVEGDKLHNTFTTVDKISDIVSSDKDGPKLLEHVIMERSTR